MRKFQFLKEKEYQTFELPNGKMVNVYACRYDCKVDLENESFILSSDKEEYDVLYEEVLDFPFVEEYLENAGVSFKFNTEVTNVIFDIEGKKKTAKTIECVVSGKKEEIKLTDNDIVFIFDNLPKNAPLHNQLQKCFCGIGQRSIL